MGNITTEFTKVKGTFGEFGSEYTLLDYSVFRRVMGNGKLEHVKRSVKEDYYSYQKELLFKMWDRTYRVLQEEGYPFDSIVVTTPLGNNDKVVWTGNIYVTKEA